MDGGIQPDTIGLASAAGASLFVSGSFIFHESYRGAVAALNQRLR